MIPVDSKFYITLNGVLIQAIEYLFEKTPEHEQVFGYPSQVCVRQLRRECITAIITPAIGRLCFSTHVVGAPELIHSHAGNAITIKSGYQGRVKYMVRFKPTNLLKGSRTSLVYNSDGILVVKIEGAEQVVVHESLDFIPDSTEGKVNYNLGSNMNYFERVTITEVNKVVTDTFRRSGMCKAFNSFVYSDSYYPYDTSIFIHDSDRKNLRRRAVDTRFSLQVYRLKIFIAQYGVQFKYISRHKNGLVLSYKVLNQDSILIRDKVSLYEDLLHKDPLTRVLRSNAKYVVPK